MQFSKGCYCSQGWQLNIHIYRHLPFVCTTFSCCSSTFKTKRKKTEEISIHPMLQKEKNERSYVWQEFPRASSSCRRTTLKSTAIFVLVLWGVRPLDWRLNGASFVVSQDIWWNGWWWCYLRFRLYILNGISFLLPSEGAFFPVLGGQRWGGVWLGRSWESAGW